MLLLALTLVAATADVEAQTVLPACEHRRAVARSEAALLFSPSIIASFGVFDRGVASALDLSDGELTRRLTAGLSYDFTNLYEGVLVLERAERACEWERASIDLSDAVSVDSASRRGLEAKAALLEKALNEADEIVGRARRDLSSEKITVAELTMLELRAHEIRRLFLEAKQTVAALPAGSAQREPIQRTVERHVEAVVALEEAEGSLRNAAAFDLEVRGGYDRLFGREQDLPAFGSVGLAINLGRIFQGFANDDAAEARRLDARRGGSVRGGDLHDRLRTVDAQLASDRLRLQMNEVLLEDLSRRLRSSEGIDAAEARRFRDFVWFEHVKLAADTLYLRLRVEDMALLVASFGTEEKEPIR